MPRFCIRLGHLIYLMMNSNIDSQIKIETQYFYFWMTKIDWVLTLHEAGYICLTGTEGRGCGLGFVWTHTLLPTGVFSGWFLFLFSLFICLFWALENNLKFRMLFGLPFVTGLSLVLRTAFKNLKKWDPPLESRLQQFSLCNWYITLKRSQQTYRRHKQHCQLTRPTWHFWHSTSKTEFSLRWDVFGLCLQFQHFEGKEGRLLVQGQAGLPS